MRGIVVGALLCAVVSGCDRASSSGPGAVGSAAVAVPAPAASSVVERRKLRVALYPYVPDAPRMFADAKTAFERAHPDVEVVPVDLEDYYDSTKDDSLMGTIGSSANVIEFDSVFRDDLLAAKPERLVALPLGSEPHERDFVGAAVQAARPDGRWIGIPHWVCSDFVYSTKSKPFSGSSLRDLEHFVGTPSHPLDTGVLTDMVGKSSIGELYLDALVDETGSVAGGLAQLTTSLLPDGEAPPPQPAEKHDLQRLLALCDPGFCRSPAFHKDTSGYAREFAEKHGSALIGYSEATYDIARTLASPACTGADAGNCLHTEDLVLSALPLADAGAHPFLWVDTLAIQSSCTGPCVTDAAAFITMMNEDVHLRGDLFPASGSPRYLLPAKTTLDAELTSRAPLYARFRALTDGAPAATGKRLGDSLRSIGGTLDSDGTLKH